MHLPNRKLAQMRRVFLEELGILGELSIDYVSMSVETMVYRSVLKLIVYFDNKLVLYMESVRERNSHSNSPNRVNPLCT